MSEMDINKADLERMSMEITAYRSALVAANRQINCLKEVINELLDANVRLRCDSVESGEAHEINKKQLEESLKEIGALKDQLNVVKLPDDQQVDGA